MRTLALWLSYDGTDFRGFAAQPGLRTVQGVLEQALAETLGEMLRVAPAARTDSGVHALCQVASFSTVSALPAEALQRACNARLPDDLVVTAARDMPDGFHARRSARRRSYRYAIRNAPLPCPLRRRDQYHVPAALDLEAMQRGAQALLGTRDFRSFTGQQGEAERARSTVRSVSRAEWRRDGALLTFEITADAFLRHMVRTIVGTLLLAGQHARGLRSMDEILAGRDRRLAGPTAPARGLTLVGVEYE